MATTATSNFYPGYKYATLEEAKEVHRKRMLQRYHANKEQLNKQRSDRKKREQEVLNNIKQYPQLYQQLLLVNSDARVYQAFQWYMQMLSDPPLYQRFLNTIMSLTEA